LLNTSFVWGSQVTEDDTVYGVLRDFEGQNMWLLRNFGQGEPWM
jgi:hypothetical protein